MRQLNATALPTARPRWRRPSPRWLRPTLRYGAMVIVAAAFAGGGFRLWQSGAAVRAAHEALAAGIAASAAFGLKVGDVTIEGRDRTEPEALIAALGIRRGEPLLAVDLGAARAKLEALPWVKSASVERRWPQLVYVKIAERTPLALWQQDGRIKLIDSDGTVIEGADTGRFAGLPMVVGDGAAKAAAALLAMLAKQPTLMPHLQAAVWVGARRWNLHLVEGIDVRLPESNADDALARLAALADKERLFSRDIVAIDLRLPDRLIVRLSPAAVPPQQPQQQRERKPGKST